MAPIAALYDIHGNAPALRAVLAEVALVPDVHVVVGGDIVWGPLPDETLELVRGIDDATVIRGNTDREIAERYPDADGLDAATAGIILGCGEAIGADGRTYLEGLPRRRRATTCCSATLAALGHGTDHAGDERGARRQDARRHRGAVRLLRPHAPAVPADGRRPPAGQPGQRRSAVRPAGRLLGADRRRHRRAATDEYDVAAATRAFETRGLAGREGFAARVTAPPSIAEIVDRFTIG